MLKQKLDARPVELTGELIDKQLAEQLIHGFKTRLPEEVSSLFISNHVIRLSTAGLKNISGIRFMYGMEDSNDANSKMILLIPCNNTSGHKQIPNSIIQPEGYYTHAGERISLKQTWRFLYNHAVRLSTLEPNQPFHKLIRGAFAGRQSLDELLTVYTSASGLNYYFGYDYSIDGPGSYKPVLIPVDGEGKTFEVFMDVLSLCPPKCDCGKPGYPDCDECLLTDMVTENSDVVNKEKELNSFRNVRDNYFHPSGNGHLVEMYYYVSPSLIEAIEASGRAKEVYADVYNKELRKCDGLITAKKFEEAKEIFETTMNNLMTTWLFDKN